MRIIKKICLNPATTTLPSTRLCQNSGRNPKSEKDIESLERAMNIALEQDNERIRFLKVEGRANAWDELYLIYKKMSDRQSLVRTVTPIEYQGRTIRVAVCRLHAGDGDRKKECC